MGGPSPDKPTDAARLMTWILRSARFWEQMHRNPLVNWHPPKGKKSSTKFQQLRAGRRRRKFRTTIAAVNGWPVKQISRYKFLVTGPERRIHDFKRGIEYGPTLKALREFNGEGA